MILQFPCANKIEKTDSRFSQIRIVSALISRKVCVLATFMKLPMVAGARCATLRARPRPRWASTARTSTTSSRRAWRSPRPRPRRKSQQRQRLQPPYYLFNSSSSNSSWQLNRLGHWQFQSLGPIQVYGCLLSMLVIKGFVGITSCFGSVLPAHWPGGRQPNPQRNQTGTSSLTMNIFAISFAPESNQLDFFDLIMTWLRSGRTCIC